MPHSITPEAMSSPGNVKNEPEEDAGIPHRAAPAPTNGENGASDSKQDVKQLEDLFDDVESDEEFPSSAPAHVQPSSQIPPGSPTYGLPEILNSQY